VAALRYVPACPGLLRRCQAGPWRRRRARGALRRLTTWWSLCLLRAPRARRPTGEASSALRSPALRRCRHTGAACFDGWAGWRRTSTQAWELPTPLGATDTALAARRHRPRPPTAARSSALAPPTPRGRSERRGGGVRSRHKDHHVGSRRSTPPPRRRPSPSPQAVKTTMPATCIAGIAGSVGGMAGLPPSALRAPSPAGGGRGLVRGA